MAGGPAPPTPVWGGGPGRFDGRPAEVIDPLSEIVLDAALVVASEADRAAIAAGLRAHSPPGSGSIST